MPRQRAVCQGAASASLTPVEADVLLEFLVLTVLGLVAAGAAVLRWSRRRRENDWPPGDV